MANVVGEPFRITIGERIPEASARRIPDAIPAAAVQARPELIATFDEAFTSPDVPVRLL